MMIILPTPEQKSYAWELVKKWNFGHRGKFNGTQEKQYVGYLGESIVCDLLDYPRPTAAGRRWDGGYDIKISGYRIDVKTMLVSVETREDFAHNLSTYQAAYEVDFYLFCHYNIRRNELTICGMIPKKEFFKYAIFRKKGEEKERPGSEPFVVKSDLYEILQMNLYPVWRPADIRAHVERFVQISRLKDVFK